MNIFVSCNYIKKIVSWIMVLAIICVTVYTDEIRTVFAAETIPEQPTEEELAEIIDDIQQDDIQQETPETEPTSSYLEQAKRKNKPIQISDECDEYTTIFQNPDGTKTAYFFQTPVRFKEKGKWAEIDNQIIEVRDEKKELGYKYKNKVNTFDLYLPEDMASDLPVLMDFKDYKISMIPIQKENTKKNRNKYKGKTNTVLVDKTKNEVALENISKKNNALEDGAVTEIIGSVKYASGFDDKTEILYTPTDIGIKEDIIIYEYTGQNEFEFLLTLEGVTPVLLKDGGILLKYNDTDKEAGKFTEMFMYDSYDGGEILEGQHFSESVTYALRDGEKKGEYIITVIADKAFLEDESTVFPVIIDPSYTLNLKTNQQDTYVSKRLKSTNYNSSTHSRVGWNSSTDLTRSYIRHTLQSINGCVISARYHAYGDTTYTSSAQVGLYRVLGDWSASTLTWNNKPSCDETTCISETTPKPVNHKDWYSWNMTSLVSKWYNGTYPNYGFMLRMQDEGTSFKFYRRFVSSNGSPKPYFVVDYSAVPSAPSVSAGNDAADGRGYLNVSWTAVAGASKYYVYNGSTKIGGTYTGTSAKIYVNPGEYNIRIKAGNTYNHFSSYSPYCATRTVLDKTAPYPSNINNITVTPGIENSSIYEKIEVVFNAVLDRPLNNSLLNSSYKLLMSDNGSSYITLDVPNPVTAGNDLKFTVTNGQNGIVLEDNKVYSFKIRAYDSAGNYSESNSASSVSYDRTGPVIDPDDVWMSTPVWTDQNPVIAWANIDDPGPAPNTPILLKYRVNEDDWINLSNYENGQGTINCSALADGEHSIDVVAYDDAGNVSNTVSFTYTKDTTAPQVTISIPSNENTVNGNENGVFNIGAEASDDNIVTWSLDYITPENVVGNISSGTSELLSTNFQLWNLSALEQNRIYTLRLTAVDAAGHISQTTAKVLYAKDAEDLAAKLTMLVTDGASQTIIGMISTETVNTGYSPGEGMVGKLCVNDIVKDIEIPGSSGLSFNPLEYDGGWLFPEGSQVFLRIVAQDGNGNYYFSNNTYEGYKITDVFDNADGVSLEDTVLDDSKIELATDNGLYIENGVIISSEQTINGRISYVELAVDEVLPEGTSIIYTLVDDSGQEYELAPNNKTNFDNIPVNRFSLKAQLSTTDSLETPSLDSWHLNVFFVPFGQSMVIENDFDINARGFCKLEGTVHDDTNGAIKLDGIEFPVVSYPESGSVCSTVRVTPGDAWEVYMGVDEEIPDGTDITYWLSTNGGATWQQIETAEEWIAVETKGNRIVLKAELTGDGTKTPVLNSWSLVCRQTMAGVAFDVKLIDEPDKLSTLVDANYMTLLRWEASETDGVTYNVYRSSMPYFEPSAETLLEEGIEENYFGDYNLVFDQRFYYKVTAVKEFHGNTRESLPSNEAGADTVSEDELYKKLGLQNYWSYSGFATGNGTGYVNVANGNMVYRSTDLVITDPFFASVVSRTFNSTGKTKTPIGYGWDFSFNTCMLKEYNEAGSEVIALVLKDGDGSFHRFEGNDADGYSSAKGTFMEFAAVRNASNEVAEYQIMRKDGITYHFDAQTMKLIKFSDLNGNDLEFSYNERGNLDAVENTVGEKIELSYMTTCRLPDNADYAYVNEHIDMLDTVKWSSATENAEYSYEYDSNDRLKQVFVTIDGQTTLVTSFAYDLNIDGDPVTVDRNIVITDAEGRKTIAELDIERKVSRVYEPVMELGDYTETDSFTFEYDPDNNGGGDKTVITNSYGVNLTYEYNEYGLLMKKTDVKGNSMEYTHNEDFLVTSVSYKNTFTGDDDETTVRNVYDYDENGNVTEIKAQATQPGGSVFTDLGPKTTFAYDPAFKNKVASQTIVKDNDGTIESVITTYDYDANGNIVSTTVADGSTGSDGESISKTTTYSYYNGAESGGYKWQLKSMTDNFGKETRYIYETGSSEGIKNGTLQHVEEYDENGDYVRTTVSYTYDGYGRTYTVSEAYDKNVTSNPNVSCFEYDALGRLIHTTNPDGTRTKSEYDLTGRVTTNKLGFMNGSTFEVQVTTEYEYDVLGRLLKNIVREGGGSGTDIVTQIEYLKWDSDYSIPGSESDKIVTTDPEGTKSIEYYDVLGRLVKTQAYDGSTCITTGQYTYDTIGNMIKAIDSTGKVSRAYYDVLNRQVRTVIDPFAAGESGHMNAETFIEYDLLGNVKKQTQRAYENETTYTDYAIEYKYDALSRLEKVKQPNPNFGQTGEPEYLETLYYYDKQVSVDGQDLVKNYKADPLGRVSETYFDKLGRKVMDFNKADTSDGDDANGEYMKTQYEYDIRGLVSKVTRTDGTFETYSYDMMGRAELIEYFEAGATESTHSIGYVHDRFGGVKTESVSEGSVTHNTSYAYDKLGRPVSVWQGTYNSSDQPVKESDGLDIAYEYNKAGQLTNIRYKTSATDVQHNLVYVYDDYGRINEIRFDPTAEANNTARKYFYDTHTGILLHTEDYRKFDKNNISDYIKTAYEYNKAGLVEQITYSDAELIDANNPSGITEQYTVQYDGRGYIVGEQHDTDYSTTEGVTSLYKAYQYDSIGRLLKSASGDTLQTGWDNWDKLTQYTYDRVGNRKSMNDGTDSVTYDYNQFDQLTALSKNNEVQTTYEYDLRGNQTKESTKHFDLTVGGVTTTYYNTTDHTYNLRNQMISANISTPEADAQTGEVTYNTVETSNIYNAQGQRIQKTEGNEATKYFYSGSAVFYTTDGGGALTTENILDLGGQIVASKRFPNPDEVGSPYANKYFFYNYDIRGSVTNIVGPDGNLVTGYEYDEFGNQSRSGDTSFLNEVTFTGSISDTSTGLQYMNARFYQPTTGRFLSQDSYTGNAYDPWTQNLYSYCGNNPTNFIDPTGHSAKYISAIDYKKQMAELQRKLKEADQWASGYYKNKIRYQDYVEQGKTHYQMMIKLADGGFKRNTKIAEEISSQIEDLQRRYDLSKIVDRQKINPVYENEEEAAAAFLRKYVPYTASDGEERSAYIIATTGYRKDENGDIVSYSGYQLTLGAFKGSTGFNNTKFIGLEAILKLPVFEKKSLVHTHPASPTGIPGFSTQDKDWMIDTFGCTNVYMAMPGDSVYKNGVYKLTGNGPILEEKDVLAPVTYY